MSGSNKPLVARLLADFCHQHGLTLHLDAGLGHAGMIEAPNGRRSCFIGTRFDLNPQGASELVRDKAYTAEFLRSAGLPVPDQIVILASTYRQHLAESRPNYLAGAYQGASMAKDFARRVGFPLFLKPVTGSGGKDVERLDSSQELALSLARLSEKHETLLLQQGVIGQDMRAVCLDDSILLALHRRPASVTGDGLSTLEELARLHLTDRKDLEQARRHVSAQGKTFESVPEEGEDVALLPVTNLSRGGEASLLHPDQLPVSIREACLSAGRILNLRYFAVDLIAREPEDNEAPFHILEVNAAPGLAELHRQGGTASTLVEEIYAEVFRAIAQPLLEES